MRDSSASRLLPLALGTLLALVFGALGAWQLDRLGDRRERNRERERAMEAPPLRLESEADELPPPDSVLWRRVTATGVWDPEREIVVRGRPWLGTPGVALLTPLRRPNGAAVLVLRGWLPAADGLSADLARALVPGVAGDGRDTREVEGLAIPGEGPSPVPPRTIRYPVGERLALGSVDLAAADSALPYPVAPYVLQALPAARSPGETHLRRMPDGPPMPFPAPELTDGPHALYAFQWFGFAAIALAAGALLPRAARSGRRPPEPPGSAGGSHTSRAPPRTADPKETSR